MRGAAEKCRLEMNTVKSKCVILNYRGPTIEQQRGMEVVEQLKYLEVTVSNRGNCFFQYEKDKIMHARKMAKLTYSRIASLQ